ncbi:Gfo/Idh/MocA family oxidoreductase [Proteiniclasticum sp. QWL-01]|uniref:Gfo/Idh/MocA family protein n=1 Tax=Proteiniclasticum sp. QWL-01 TaxID=3036945 RepID=UPI00240FE31A|nr:Gfo/Idh/MocA family oxidoreductase [Proteiniclasticum sp. QWL-01]WFF71917.1 Gfo/Idh/MocA family oxidoreductase [Proteiniclasticum sp. QWL-01]
MKFAIIGCGRISVNHFAAAQANGLEIVAICDVIPERMDEKAQAFGLAQVKKYTDYREMLRHEAIDLAAICTESGKHGSIALDCIDAGVHLIIEKPITLSLPEADEIIRRSTAKGVTVCACHQNRFNKSVQKIREAMEHGRFGRLLHGTAHIRWNRGESYYSQAPWRGTWEQDGGALMNQCIHNIDLLRWMMGNEIEEVVAYTDNLMHPFIEAEDLGMALVKFSNGSYGMIEGTTNIFPQNLEETLYLFGQDGTVKAGGKSVNIIEEWLFRDQLDDPEEIKTVYHENPPNVYGFGHTPLYQDVIAAIREGRPPYITAQDGRNALELVLAIYQSAASGKPVRLPLTEVASTDFEGRFSDRIDVEHVAQVKRRLRETN